MRLRFVLVLVFALLLVLLAVPGLAQASVVFNDRLAIQVGASGAFNMGAYPDATGSSGDGSFNLMYAWPGGPSTSYTTLRIDGHDEIYGAGTLFSPPENVDAETNVSSWQTGDIKVTQTLSLALNAQTGLEDVARIAYMVENLGTVSHSVGLRFMNDTMINEDDGVPFRIPGQGILTTESDFAGSDVPDSFQVFYDVTDDYHVASATLRGGDATSPDRLVLASWPNMVSFPRYDYTTTPGLVFTNDSAYALYWDPTDLAPGASRTYVTYYGLGEFDADLAPPLALGLSGPASLTSAGGGYTPNPFTVTATLLNNGTATATAVQLSLNLPAGLTLASGSAVESLEDLPVGAERQVTWSVLAQPQTADTVLSYSVTASATNAEDKTVSRQIALPAVAVDTPADLAEALVEDFDQWVADGHCV